MEPKKLVSRVNNRLADWGRDRRLIQLNRQVTNNAHIDPDNQAVAFFTASTRLTGISLNAAFSHLTACGLQLAGVPVAYFVCRAGMSRCVLGTNWSDPERLPPCNACISQSQRLFMHAPVVQFSYQEDPRLRQEIEQLDVARLSGFEFHAPERMDIHENLPLGQLVLPSIRWISRLHNLNDDETTRFIFREYILSAWQVADEFNSFLDQIEPQALVVFNGIFYPEAIARWVAKRRGVRVITHEVGFRPFSAYFSHQEATAYPIEIPPDYRLSESENEQLDSYLEQRFQGNFTMAGVKFWSEISNLDEEFLHKISQFDQVVTVFTNVIFDTSQIHANSVFPDMFAWLDLVHRNIKDHPETLFVIRAHPDELRIGKESRQNVPDWIASRRIADLPNVVFIHPNEPLSSYELIRRSKFILVYNSSVGLEAALMGKAVLSGGKSRYSPYDIVYSANSSGEYQLTINEFISKNGNFEIPKQKIDNARRFMYFQFFKVSLPFDEYLQAHTQPGYVSLKSVNWRQLLPDNSETMRTLVNGILHSAPFVLN